MKKVVVHGCDTVKGVITPVTSKSISNRALIINFLSGNQSTILNLSQSDDTNVLVKLLHLLSASNDNIELNTGHAGTVMRFLITAACLSGKTVILNGSKRMTERPVKELVETLQSIGANIEFLEKDGFPPLRIYPSKITGGKLKINSSVSSQFISSLMLCAPYFENETEIELIGSTVSYSYIELTKKIMCDFGAQMQMEDNFIRIKNKPYSTISYAIEGDWSSASYFFALAALSKNAVIELNGIKMDTLQGDSAIKNIAQNFGVKATTTTNGIIIEKFEEKKYSEFEYNFNLCPDIAQTIAVLTSGLAINRVLLKGLSTLIIKETNRINALKTELKKFEVEFLEEENNELSYNASAFNTKGNISINTYDDHRMAMSFAVLAQKTGKITIYDPLVVSKSYINFWNDLNLLGCLTEFSDI